MERSVFLIAAMLIATAGLAQKEEDQEPEILLVEDITIFLFGGP
jgi:hypothetical protein